VGQWSRPQSLVEPEEALVELLDSLSPRRRELLDAAVTVAARDGLRGLTHRAVDRQAGLPEGSCSAYLRTRAALQEALAEYVAAQLTRELIARLLGSPRPD